MKKIFLFDLDSTLLQMNQDVFLKKYFGLIYKKAKEYGFEPNSFMNTFNKMALKIITNDGSKTNEDLFWNGMMEYYPNIEEIKAYFSEFYQNEFKSISEIVDKNDIPSKIINYLNEKGYTLILATNPLFPKECTYERMAWAGLKPTDFKHITTYDNCTFCKPKAEYYEEIFNTLGLDKKEAIMIGNDLSDDFSDLPNEVDKILITDYLINEKNLPITMPSFTLLEFYNYIKEHY